MFYILIFDDAGHLLNQIEESDYESFITVCYNFCQDEGLENLYVSYITDNEEVYRVPLAGIEKMIGYWLDCNDMSP